MIFYCTFFTFLAHQHYMPQNCKVWMRLFTQVIHIHARGGSTFSKTTYRILVLLSFVLCHPQFWVAKFWFYKVTEYTKVQIFQKYHIMYLKFMFNKNYKNMWTFPTRTKFWEHITFCRDSKDFKSLETALF